MLQRVVGTRGLVLFGNLSWQSTVDIRTCGGPATTGSHRPPDGPKGMPVVWDFPCIKRGTSLH